MDVPLAQVSHGDFGGREIKEFRSSFRGGQLVPTYYIFHITHMESHLIRCILLLHAYMVVHPTTNSGTQNGSSVGLYTYIHALHACFFSRFGIDFACSVGAYRQNFCVVA